MPAEDQTKTEQCCDLKIERVQSDDLRRNDLILFDNDIWRCESINMKLFQNLQTKIHKKIPSVESEVSQIQYIRVSKLQLIPKEWKFKEEKQASNQNESPKITLKGQELGLGPIHEIEVMGMRRFEELEVVRSQKERGREIAFKVILCETRKKNCYLIAGVDFLN